MISIDHSQTNHQPFWRYPKEFNPLWSLGPLPLHWISAKNHSIKNDHRFFLKKHMRNPKLCLEKPQHTTKTPPLPLVPLLPLLPPLPLPWRWGTCAARTTRRTKSLRRPQWCRFSTRKAPQKGSPAYPCPFARGRGLDFDTYNYTPKSEKDKTINFHKFSTSKSTQSAWLESGPFQRLNSWLLPYLLYPGISIWNPNMQVWFRWFSFWIGSFWAV